MATQFEEFEFPDEVEAKKSKAAAAAAEDKFEIEIEDDTPPEDRGRKPMAKPPEDPTEDELSSYDEKVQARIKKFTRGYHDERRAKEEALRERQAAEAYAKQVLEENKRLQQQIATGSKAFIETSKVAAEAQLAAAKEKFTKAYEAGDAQAQAEAQAAIADATVRASRISDMKPVEVEEREFKPAPVQPEQPRLHPRTQQWVDANNDWYGVDEEMTASAVGLDKKLQREYGTDFVGTEKYFQLIDKTMRKRFPEHFESEQSQNTDEDEEETPPPRRATKPASVVAPASRSTPPNRIRLKASEAEIARRLGVPIEQYAKQVALLRKGA